MRVLIFLACLVTAFAQKQAVPRAADGHPDLSGVWMVSGSPNIATDPPYRPEARELWNKRRADKSGQDDPAAWCLPNGVVRVTTLPYKIVQTPKLVVLLS